MIKVLDKYFILETEKTSYVFYINEAGNPVHLYYGQKVDFDESSLLAITPVPINPIGCGCALEKEHPAIFLDDCCLEVTTTGKGDYSEPLLSVVYKDGSSTTDLRFDSFETVTGNVSPDGLPDAYGADETLILKLKDLNSSMKVDLIYSLYVCSDCITRFTRIHSIDEELKVERLMSLQLDSYKAELKITSFHGEWVREMSRFDTVLKTGKFVSDSNTGNSSNKANPFVMFGDVNVNEEYGEVYATNLIYSGNHREYFEIGGHHKTHMLTGINPDRFKWNMKENETLDSPVAVMTFSNTGYSGISKNMHKFVRENIVRGKWKDKDRPVLLNSWEANYFNIKENNLLKLAKLSKETGIELFVMDDGWFGKRNNDTSSLGDWYPNKDKLSKGLKGLSKKIHNLGLMFGIWVEPEMVNEDSDLFRAHPDYAVRIPGRDQALGRNQYVLDLTKDEVVDYIISSMTKVFEEGNVDYVKWDMNRNISDNYSIGATYDQGEFAHRYMLGLYKVMDELTKRFPDILFEGCASGGNRFDLGILCYFQQIWASDDSDAVERARIQTNYSYGYPQSAWGSHVSECPNHQTIRITPLKTRFAVASVGLLGYELNLCDIKSDDLAEIKKQIEEYKEHRHTYQFGNLHRLDTGDSNLDSDITKWIIVSEDKKEAIGITVQGLAIPNFTHRTFVTKGLHDNLVYHVYNIPSKHDIHIMGGLINTMAPIHVRQDSLVHDVIAKFVKLDSEVIDLKVRGEVLNKAGIHLPDVFAGTGYGTNTSIYRDFDAKIIYFENEEHIG